MPSIGGCFISFVSHQRVVNCNDHIITLTCKTSQVNSMIFSTWLSRFKLLFSMTPSKVIPGISPKAVANLRLNGE